MQTEGKFVIPEELCVGNSFSGFKVEASVNKQNCHVWVFSRNNKAVVVPISYDDYFTLLSDPLERERIMDYLAMQIHAAYMDKQTNQDNT